MGDAASDGLVPGDASPAPQPMLDTQRVSRFVFLPCALAALAPLVSANG